MALSDIQKRFCDEYLVVLNATQAALNAGYKKGTARYASKWINENENPQKPTDGKKTKFNPEMRKYIDGRMAEKEKDLIADQEEVMKYLTSVMRREKKESVVVTLQNKTEKWVKDEETGKMKKQTITEESPAVVEIPARLSDSNKAAELLGRAYGTFTEKVNVDVNVPVMFDGEDSIKD